MYDMPIACQTFFQETVDLCKKHNIILDLQPTDKVKLSENLLTSGYFDEKSLVMGINKPFKDWFFIFIHESNHLRQFLYNKNLWNRKVLGQDPCGLMDEWIGGNYPFTNWELEQVIKAARHLERDCEKMSVRTIINYQMPLDVVDYTKRANAYLYFYDLVHLYGRWCDTPPYTSDRIVSKMPGHRILDVHKLNPYMEKIFHDECYN